MQRRFDESRGNDIATILESTPGKHISESMKMKLASGASELDLVYSGLAKVDRSY